MLRGSLSLYTCLFAGSLVASGAAPAFAQNGDQTGIARVSSPSVSQIEPIPQNAGVEYGSEVYYENCPPGHAYRHGHQKYVRTFSPPVKRPIYRSGVAYYKMFPNQWNGHDAVPVTNYQYPSVYMPTDTTQLGYYYQHVPYWQPRQGMVPPAPVPSQWHTTVAQSQYHGHIPAGKIIGTAPTAVPVSQPQAPSPPGVTPTPADIPSTPIEPVIQPSAGLERPAAQPALLPIN